MSSNQTLPFNTVPTVPEYLSAMLDAVDRQFDLAEMNYLISYGWRPCGYYQTPEGVWTKELLWVPPVGYPTYAGKEHGVATRHAVNSQRKQRREWP